MGKSQVGQRTLALVAYERVGLRRATAALSWLVSYGIAADTLGGRPSAEAVAGYWGEASRATVYREAAAWAVAFPELDHAAAWEQARRLVRSRSRAAALEVGGLIVPGLG